MSFFFFLMKIHCSKLLCLRTVAGSSVGSVSSVSVDSSVVESSVLFSSSTLFTRFRFLSNCILSSISWNFMAKYLAKKAHKHTLKLNSIGKQMTGLLRIRKQKLTYRLMDLGSLLGILDSTAEYICIVFR